ncbi:MAG TPA: CehA/McbA family metallohydrolase [Oscillospiraceae bacterium]|nr:CehA/McbA family metallohydrolase [Oscillospiraceae bacterium]
MQTVTGNIHIHSTHSDGAGTIEEITQAAAAVGLDYLIITDHQTLAGLAQEGYQQGVLVLCGSEINRTSHHYLALGIDEEVPNNDDQPQKVIDAVNEQGGLGFIAHPYETGSPFVLDGITYPWENWQVEGFCGIEVWNWCSQWRDSAQGLLSTLYHAYFKPEAPITGPCPQAFAQFDRLTQQQKLTAIAGSDAHDYHLRCGPLRRRIFPYQYLFRTANNHLLLPQKLSSDATEAKRQILTALRQGRAFIANHLVGSAEGFSCTASSEAGIFQLGDTVKLTPHAALEIICPSTPRPPSVTVIRNGQPWRQQQAHHWRLNLQLPGTYRLEVRLNSKPWIFTNPLYVM